MGMQQQQQEELAEGGVGKRTKVAAALGREEGIVTMNLGILDCPVCFHPLHPPSSRYPLSLLVRLYVLYH